MKFDEFIAQKRELAAPRGRIIVGAFDCQECSGQSIEAEYFAAEKYLRWECAEGHVSFIEDMDF